MHHWTVVIHNIMSRDLPRKRGEPNTREKVFARHVLRKLHGTEYPNPREETSSLTTSSKSLEPEVSQSSDTLHPVPAKSYTVTPPPEDWCPAVSEEGQGISVPTEELPSTSSEEAQSDSDNTAVTHKRRRRGKRIRNLGNTAEHKQSPEGVPSPEIKTLTKNQKRKLKKKRHKEKIKLPTSEEFVYNEQSEDNKQSCHIPSEEDLAGLRQEVARFLQEVWDVYAQEAHHEVIPDLIHTRHLQLVSLSERLLSGMVTDRDVAYLAKLKFLATAKDSETVKTTIESPEKMTSLISDDRLILEILLTYWSRTVQGSVTLSTKS